MTQQFWSLFEHLRLLCAGLWTVTFSSHNRSKNVKNVLVWEKIIFHFSIFFFLFLLTDSILSGWVDKNMNRLVISRLLRKCDCFWLISKHRDIKQKFRFTISLFFNRLNIILLGRQKYGLISNFKTFKKIRLIPTDI